MAAFKNEFSWSWSRHRAFETCLRRYWLNHYGFWNGWRRGHPAREIYIQKKLNSRPQWLGITVHKTVEEVLDVVRSRPREAWPAPQQVVDRARRRAHRMIQDSEAGRYRDDPKRKPGFLDHYYDLGTKPEAWDADVAEIERQVAGVFEHPVFQRLSRVPGQIAEIERLQQIRIEGIRVWVSLDVLVRDADGGFVIIDWKTGRHHDPDAVARQLAVYGLYVHETYLADIPLEEALGRVKGMYVNLRTGEYETRTLTAEVVGETRAALSASAAAMRERLVDVDENIADEADFPMLPEGSEECGRCPFRRTCGREAGGRGREPSTP